VEEGNIKICRIGREKAGYEMSKLKSTNENSSIQSMAIPADGDVSMERLGEESNRQRQYKAVKRTM